MSVFYDENGKRYYEDNTGCFEKIGILAYGFIGLYICNRIYESTHSLTAGFLSFVALWVLTYLIKSKLEGPALKIFGIVGVILFIIIVIVVAFTLWSMETLHGF